MMKVHKIRSIKQASFFSIMKGSLLFVIINFLFFFIFLITFAYLFISSQEENLSKILINDLSEKQQRIASISESLAKTISEGSDENSQKVQVENAVMNFKEIQGILIMDSNGIIIQTSSNYKEFMGIDFSGKDYYKRIIDSRQKRTLTSNSYVSHMTKKVTLNVVSPIVRDNRLLGMVVVLINPSIIENKELKDMEYYLVDANGDILFHSYDDNIITKEDNIKNSSIMKNGLGRTNGIIYKDKLLNKVVIGTIRKDPFSSAYIVVQHNLLDNKVLVNGLLIILGVAILIVFLFILIFSVQISSIITKYINLFRNEVKKVAAGDYDIKLSNIYAHEEINDIVENFNNMAHKIKYREEELQAYNEELVAANDEIKSILSTLNKTEKERKEQYLQIIWTMVNLLEIKDEYTAGHSKSVTYYAEQISERLNNSYGFKLDIERIQIAAMLHDIGKIGIDKEILSKPERLTKEQYEIIKTHPLKGYYALKDIESLKEERSIIKYHHERYDGAGYPEGLKGDEIPLGARIICVADAFDAMVSCRPYRDGMPTSMAMQELIKNKGTQFDPFVVEVFAAMLMEEQSKAE
jgi:HD-GYP domain-containing protein (c-di-GMP phosphodiesterase class II)